MHSTYKSSEPIAAIATALAPSALAIIRLSGENTIDLFAKVFSRPKVLAKAAGNSLVYGWIVNEHNERLDEVMVGLYRNPKSFTGEDMIEVYCHGGTSAVLAIFALLCRSGFRQAKAGEFTFRAFINGKADLTKAEAIKEIIAAKTDEGRSRAAGRLGGSLYAELEAIKQLLIHTMAAIEVEIEYPEDEETIADAFDPAELLQAQQKLQLLSQTWAAEKLYQEGARTVICGKTNAGKSSLFNMLLKEDRAIVSDIHGTTRDWLESWVNIAGLPIRLFDTAGLRVTDDQIEQAGVERTIDLSQDADLILYVLDATIQPSQDDRDFITGQQDKTPTIIIWNKWDKLASEANNEPEKNIKKSYLQLFELPAVFLSTKTGQGFTELSEAIHSLLSQETKTERIQAGLGTERQKQAVEAALESIGHGLSAAQSNFPLDAVIQDLEEALDSLGEITGETTPDDILDKLFSGFCVGK